MSASRQNDRIPFRKRIGKFFKTLTSPRAPVVRANAPSRDDQFHYVISSVQEDEIRESFLVEKIRCYTQSLSESDFESIMQELNEPGDTLDKNNADNSTGQGYHEDDDSECENGFISVPFPGEQCQGSPEDAQKSTRKAPNSCAICISSFEQGDRVTWSSNKECTHVFHESCIIDWLNSSGRRHLRRRRRQNQHEGVLNYANDPLRKITRFPMPCPCCRQAFVFCSEAIDDSSAEERVSTQPVDSPNPSVPPTEEDHQEQSGSTESDGEAEESNGADGSHYTSSCVELSPSDEASNAEEECSTASTPPMASLAIQVEV